ncbi:MAG: hypothetical protein PHF47_03560 [Bacilli bacterium]|nr:hypothetical protein [Bacilli bacterium]
MTESLKEKPKGGFLKTIFSSLLLLIFIFIVIVCASYHIVEQKWASWDAINAIGRWAAIFVSILIPFAVIYLQSQLEKNKVEIKGSNVSLSKRIYELEQKTKNMPIFKNIKELPDNPTKEDIFNFISVSMGATLKEIADHFSVKTDDVRKKVSELCLNDDKIYTRVYSNPKNPSDNSTWFRRG